MAGHYSAFSATDHLHRKSSPLQGVLTREMKKIVAVSLSRSRERYRMICGAR